MEIFVELKKYFKTMGIERNLKSRLAWRIVIALILFAYCCGAMVALLLFDPNKTFMDLGNAFFGAVSLALNVSTLLSNVINRKKIFSLMENLDGIITKRLAQRTFIYDGVYEKIEIWSKVVHIAFMKVSYPFVYFPKLLLSYYGFFKTHDSEAFELGFPMSSPFDWKTPFGYLAAFSIQFMTWFFLLLNCTCILSFLSGVCWILMSFIEDIGMDLNDLKEIEKDWTKRKEKFFDIIEFHSKAKQFVYDFSEIYDIIITGYYLWSILTISSTLLVIHVEMSHNGSLVDILFASLLIFWAFIQMFVFCDLGEKVSTRFGQIDNLIYCCDWYKFPKDIQRVLPTVMMAAQEPVVLQGFINLKCTRDAFKKVIQGGCSYFMTLRQFAR